MTDTRTTDLLEAGDELEPLDFHVTREFNENYLHAVEDFHARYLEAAGDRAPLVHTALLVNYSNLTRSPSFRLPEGVSAIHTHEEIDFMGTGTRGRDVPRGLGGDRHLRAPREALPGNGGIRHRTGAAGRSSAASASTPSPAGRTGA